MKVIICGAGKVGFSISKQLSTQGHSVTVIDQSSEDIKKINDTQDVKGIVGRASLPSVLEIAGAEKADNYNDWASQDLKKVTVTTIGQARSCLLYTSDAADE